LSQLRKNRGNEQQVAREILQRRVINTHGFEIGFTLLVTRSSPSHHPPFTQYPSPSRSLVRDGQTSPHKPRLVVPHSTCPSLSPSPPAHSFIIGPAVINTHTRPAVSTSSNKHIPQIFYASPYRGHASFSDICGAWVGFGSGFGIGFTLLLTRSSPSRHAPFTQYPSPSRSLVRDGQTSPHKPRLVVPHSTCPSLSPSPPAHSFIIGPAVINTHTHAPVDAHVTTNYLQVQNRQTVR
jgi:hypothetical protein